jgi:DNA-binding transcriptional LysR family regulator
VATHILPKVIGRFQKDYPAIEYELLMGDYTEIDGWVASGRVDFGFLPRAPRYSGLAERVVERDELMAVLPVGHRLAGEASVPVSALCEEPFIVLERGQDDEITPIFERAGLSPNARFSTWDDYAIMSMVESGLGLSILPALILRRNPYAIVAKPLDPATYRDIRVVYREGALPRAARRFLEYL